MNEKLLQYIWQFQYYNKADLALHSGEPLQILHPGHLNTHQGPDFLHGSIRIGETLWVGNIELHVKASDWVRHSHSSDKNYESVVLHVVWENDNGPSAIPVLELQDKVPKMLLRQYADWMDNQAFIPCEHQVSSVKEIIRKTWLERLLVQRLEKRTTAIEKYLDESKGHWEETFWRLIARNFGAKVNSEAFDSLAKSLPLNILVRHKNQIHQLEALLLGQCGLLDKEFEEKYPQMLKKEYVFYRKKYSLRAISDPVHFLRMRPGNFPTVRLAQLAMLIHQSSHMFSKLLELPSVKDIRQLLNVTANDYWHYHYQFDAGSPYKPKQLGSSMIDNIIINTIAPIIFGYGHLMGKGGYKQSALQWLVETGAEDNSIVAGFRRFDIGCSNAYESQALIELKTVYCEAKRCLDCAIGNSILNQSLYQGVSTRH